MKSRYPWLRTERGREWWRKKTEKALGRMMSPDELEFCHEQLIRYDTMPDKAALIIKNRAKNAN